MMEGSHVRFCRRLICTVWFMFTLIHCLVNAQRFDGFLTINTTWSVSDVSTTVASTGLSNEHDASAIMITNVVHQSFSSQITSWSFLSFVQTGNDEYVLSIVLSGSPWPRNGGVVWAANGDNPVSQNGILELQSDGNLVLSDSIIGGLLSSGRRIIWSTKTGGKKVTGMRLSGGGVLRILGKANATLWQSSDNPTDTLLLGQYLRVGQALVSRRSLYNLSHGTYSLQVRPRGLGLYVNGPDTASSELYWMWNVYNESALTLDQNCSGISFNATVSWPVSSLGLKFLLSTTSSALNMCNISSFTPDYYLSRGARANLLSDAVYIRRRVRNLWACFIGSVSPCGHNIESWGSC